MDDVPRLANQRSGAPPLARCPKTEFNKQHRICGNHGVFADADLSTAISATTVPKFTLASPLHSVSERDPLILETTTGSVVPPPMAAPLCLAMPEQVGEILVWVGLPRR